MLFSALNKQKRNYKSIKNLGFNSETYYLINSEIFNLYIKINHILI